MAHFAKISSNIVTDVIVAEQDYIDWRKSNFPNEEWVQTSYNTRGGVHYDPITGLPSEDQSKALRKNYAGPDYFYDRNRDVFIPPKPYSSWILNESTCLWKSPVTFPTIKTYANAENVQVPYFIKWNENLKKWIAAETDGTEDIFLRSIDFTKVWNNESSSWENLIPSIIEDSL
jgi:hypothetical protein